MKSTSNDSSGTGPDAVEPDDRQALVAALTRSARLEAELAGLRHKLSAAQVELAMLARLMVKAEDDVERARRGAKWLSALAQSLYRLPWRISILPRPIRRAAIATRLKKQQLFDIQSYLARYPDVVAAGQDPVMHYVAHGLPEGRER